MRVILQRFTPQGVNLLKRIAPSSNGKRTVSETDNLGSIPRGASNKLLKYGQLAQSVVATVS